MGRQRAVQAYEDFHGEAPGKILKYVYPDGDIWAHRLGQTTAIAYKTRRDGKREDYIHEFGEGKGPYIDVGPDGEVFLTEGAFDVTDRGFEDDPMPLNLLTVNPHERGTRRTKKAFPMAKAKRNSKGQFVKRSKSAPKRKRNPVRPLRSKTRRARSRAPAIVYQETRTVKKRRKSNPIFGGRRGGGRTNPVSLVVNAAQQGAGGIIVSWIVGAIREMVPDSMKAPVPLAALKIAISAAIAMFGPKFVSRALAENAATGGATVAMYDLMRSFIGEDVPMGQIQADVPMGAIYSPDMGAWFLTDADTGQALIWQEGMDGWQTIDTPQDMAFATAANTVYDVPRYN